MNLVLMPLLQELSQTETKLNTLHKLVHMFLYIYIGKRGTERYFGPY